MISLTSPVKTRAHGWPAGPKLLALCIATVTLFFLSDLTAHLVALGCTIVLYAAPGRLFLATGLSCLRMLWPFLLIIGLWHLIEGSYEQGAVIALRLITAVALANLVTMTTKLSEMIEVVHFLMAPLRRLGVSTRPIEIAIAIVVRTTPMLTGKANALRDAWRARACRRVNWRIVLPFTLLVLDDADRMSEALKARGGLVNMKES